MDIGIYSLGFVIEDACWHSRFDRAESYLQQYLILLNNAER